MKRHRLSFVLIVLLISMTILSCFSVESLGASTLDFTFQGREIYNSDSISLGDGGNIRNVTVYTDDYNATYINTNDVVGNTPIGFNVLESGGSVRVIASENNHNKVLEMDDDGLELEIYAEVEISNVSSGTFEFWILLEQTGKAVYFYVEDGPVVDSISLRWADGILAFYNGTWNTIDNFVANNWYYIRIDFECGAGAYLGLGADRFNIEINGESFGSGYYDMRGDPSEMDAIRFRSSSVASGIYNIDALGLDWDDYYNLYDNLIPIINISNTLEVNKWEWEYNADGTATSPSEPVVPFWSETSGSTQISPQGDGRSVLFYAITTTHYTIEHDFTEVSGFERFGFSFWMTAMIGGGGIQYYDFNMYSYDDTLIAKIRIYGQNTLDLTYYDGVNYIVLYSNFHSILPITFSFNIDVIDNNMVYFTSSIGINKLFPILSSGKDGIGKVSVDVWSSSTDSGANMYLNDILILIDGSSLTDDFAKYTIDNIDWNIELDTTIEINATGEFAMSIAKTYETTTIKANKEYSGFERFNTGYMATRNYTGATIQFVTNVEFNIFSLNIFQVYLQESSNEYYPVYTWGGTNINESYFYVDSNNRLQYKLIVDDHDNEYIQAIFNINDLSTENRSIKFSSNINGNAYGFFSVNYYDSTASVIDIPYYSTKTNIILPQTKIVDEFLILITDNDLTNNTICTGYISNIQLIYNPDLQVTITTLTLLAIIVPLMIMIIPPITLHKKFGITGVFVMFLLMSIVCVATGLIPVWLFFIIALSSIGLLAMKKEVGDKI